MTCFKMFVIDNCQSVDQQSANGEFSAVTLAELYIRLKKQRRRLQAKAN
jgi:hypothetical protein